MSIVCFTRFDWLNMLPASFAVDWQCNIVLSPFYCEPGFCEEMDAEV